MCLQLCQPLSGLGADLCPCFAQEQSSAHNVCMGSWVWNCVPLTENMRK